MILWPIQYLVNKFLSYLKEVYKLCLNQDSWGPFGTNLKKLFYDHANILCMDKYSFAILPNIVWWPNSVAKTQIWNTVHFLRILLMDLSERMMLVVSEMYLLFLGKQNGLYFFRILRTCGSPKECLMKFGDYCLKGNMIGLTHDEQ